MGKVDGKVAFITGAARGQGRAHALRLAKEGADIIAVDICGKIASSVGKPSTPEDLAETVKLVEALDRRIVATQADVRDYDALSNALEEGVDLLGRVDIVCANAGMWNYKLAHEISEEEWREVIDIVLTGVWHTCKAVIPRLIDQGDGGSIIITSSSIAGGKGIPHLAHYAAAKHGVVGLMRTLASELGPYKIRVNTIHPGGVNTDMTQNQPTFNLFAPDLVNPTREQVIERFAALGLMGVPWLEPDDVSSAVLYLASDDGRYTTGTTMVVDLGMLNHP